jgi:hypothetical protein
MRKIRIFFLLSVIMLLFSNSRLAAQTGIGVAGGGNYPGFSSSESLNLRFKTGIGYSVFIRHAVMEIGGNSTLHARYSADIFYNWIDLPSENNVTYSFTAFSAALLLTFNEDTPYRYYGGISLGYVSSKSESRYFMFSSEEFIPKLLAGFEYQIAEYYNLYSELFFQYGVIDAAQEPLPVHGMGIMIGATMFFSKK